MKHIGMLNSLLPLAALLAAWPRQFQPPGIPEKPRNDLEAKGYPHYFENVQ